MDGSCSSLSWFFTLLSRLLPCSCCCICRKADFLLSTSTTSADIPISISRPMLGFHGGGGGEPHFIKGRMPMMNCGSLLSSVCLLIFCASQSSARAFVDPSASILIQHLRGVLLSLPQLLHCCSCC